MSRALLVFFTAFAVCVASLALVGCPSLLGPSYAYYLASVDASAAVIPDTVAVDSTFTITFHTGGGGCETDGYTQATMIDGRTAEIRAYDQREVDPSACTTIAKIFLHSTPVQFTLTGSAAIRFIIPSGDTTIAVIRSVAVR
jgi:hypothetical protein